MSLPDDSNLLPENFKLSGLSVADHQALEAERDVLLAKVAGYEEAFNAAIDQDLLAKANVLTRQLLTGMQHSLLQRDAGKFMNAMLEQVARSGIKLIQRDELLRDCLMSVAHGEDFDLPVSIMDRIRTALESPEPALVAPTTPCPESVLYGLPEALESLSGCENTAGVGACIDYIKAEIESINALDRPWLAHWAQINEARYVSKAPD